jgi:LmbE family N-acetylglucosaminyl deacetylase
MNMPSREAETLLFIHAHPDDEALLTAGTMAKATAEGHRVVLLVATDGAAGLTSREFGENLASVREEELRASASALGVEEVISWSLPDSGLLGDRPHAFAHRDLDQLSHQLQEVIADLAASIVIGYDSSGGYGHPDHLKVHQLARHAYQHSRSTYSLFEATLPREPIAYATKLAQSLHLTPKDFDSREFATAWTPRSQITHRVNVRSHIEQKKNAIKAHASQAHADDTLRTLGVLSKLPNPVFNALMGTEYFVKVPKNLGD